MRTDRSDEKGGVDTERFYHNLTEYRQYSDDMAIWTEDTEDRLITLIQERPALYDISEKHYSNRAVKADLWREIESKLELSGKIFLPTLALTQTVVNGSDECGEVPEVSEAPLLQDVPQQSTRVQSSPVAYIDILGAQVERKGTPIIIIIAIIIIITVTIHHLPS